jgi:hypothetical protein
MEEVIRVFFNELVINRIVIVLLGIVSKILYLLLRFFNFSFLAFDKMKDFHRIGCLIISFTLYNCNFSLSRNHASHEGSSNSQEDIISCYDLRVNITLCKGINC